MWPNSPGKESCDVSWLKCGSEFFAGIIGQCKDSVQSSRRFGAAGGMGFRVLCENSRMRISFRAVPCLFPCPPIFHVDPQAIRCVCVCVLDCGAIEAPRTVRNPCTA